MHVNHGFKFRPLITKLAALAFVSLSFSVASQEDAVWRYAFRPGDNLIHFGKKHLVNPQDWKVLKQLNKIKNPKRIPVGTVIDVPLYMVKFKSAEVKVLSVSGDCSKQNVSGNKASLKVGDSLAQGERLATGANSQMVIQFADGSTSQLNSNTAVTLDTLSLYSGGAMVDTRLRLQKGQVETHANPKHKFQTNMDVQTPSAIAAVRGTKFRVNAEEDLTIQETLDGNVDFGASGQVVNIAAGYGTKAKKGEPPKPPVKLLPAIDAHLLKTKFKRLPVAFDLPQLKGAEKWQSQVAKDTTFNQVVAEVDSSTQVLDYDDLPDGQYYLKVRAQDASGISGYDATHVFLVDARPFAPIVPADTITYKTPQPEIQWQPIDDAIAYQVQVSKQGGGQGDKFVERIKESKFKVHEPLTEGSYVWRVAAIAKSESGKVKQGEYSKAAYFEYIAPPPMPDIGSLGVDVLNNRVYVNAQPTIKDYQYHVVLNNPKNNQQEVWVGTQLPPSFDFLLKEYGKQELLISYIDADGVIGPAAVYEFDAYSIW